MVVWINGTFGVGKTTTANEWCARDETRRLFDPEIVGYMLQAQLRDRDFDDFQDLDAWRRLVPRVMREVSDETGQHLVAVQTVLNESYWNELRVGLATEQVEVVHVVLDCAPDVLARRIDTDDDESDASQWRHDHIDRFLAARDWLFAAADIVIDTTEISARQVVDTLVANLDAPR